MSYRMNRLTGVEINAIQDLIQTNVDSCNLFEDAARHIENPQVSNILHDISQQRRNNSEELKQFVIAAGETPEDRPSLGGQTREIWLRFRSALNRGDPSVILAEAERSEDHVKERYEEAIQETTGSAASQMLHHQFARIQHQHEAVRELREAHQQHR